MYKKRIERVRAALAKREKPSALLVTSEVSAFYLSGMSSSNARILITPARALYYTDFRYIEAARDTLPPEYEVMLTVGRGGGSGPGVELGGALAKAIADEDITEVLLEEDSISWAYKARLDGWLGADKLAGDGGIVAGMRRVKDEYELGQIKAAQAISDAAYEYIVGYIRKNRTSLTEARLALEIERFLRSNGAEGAAFDVICVSGKRSSLPHGEPTRDLLDDGFLVMDFGAKVGGYCSDMTRTVCLGRADAEMRRVYSTVLAAQEAAFAKIKAGVTGSEVDAAARELIEGAGYPGSFGHALGHSLGLEIHETPSFAPGEERIVDAGCVLSVEPGIYLAGKYGVRIEDIIIVREGGYENLTGSAKELTEIY